MQEISSEASPWASRRKAIYFSVVVLVLAAVSFAVFWKYWYMAPTCFDGFQNGDEAGVDCGGSCTLICSADVLKPIVKWDPRIFEVSAGLWSVLVYVENPNTNADAIYAPYTFTLYDKDNNILEERKGATILPRNKTVGVFEGNFNIVGETKPKRVIFEFDNNIRWNKSESTEEKITITHSPILRLDSAPRIEAKVVNNTIEEIKNIELVATIFDGSDNAVAASRTFVESLNKNENADVLFTWPKPFALGAKFCEKPSQVMLLLDRSGSMAASGSNPPEPLNSAKQAAISFVEQLGAKDKVGVVSFATEAQNPINSVLVSDFSLAKKAIDLVAISASSTQYTNIYDALHLAWQELISGRSEEKNSKIIILLTDGVANNPKDPQGRTEEEDIKYAENLAVKESQAIKKENIIIYTIGLGNKINESFLKIIASVTENYFFAPTAADLETIYKNISSDICEEVPAKVEITYKIFGSSI